MFRKPERSSDREDLRPHETSHLTEEPVEISFSWNHGFTVARLKLTTANTRTDKAFSH